jgi:hypothetical protein
MRRAVKNLIKMRKLDQNPINIVNVISKPHPNRQIGDCFDNAVDEYEQYKGLVKVVAGWIVGEWDGKWAPATCHFWNYDILRGQHYDTTPLGYFKKSQNITYIVDDDVFDIDPGDLSYYKIAFDQSQTAWLVEDCELVRLTSDTQKYISNDLLNYSRCVACNVA